VTEYTDLLIPIGRRPVETHDLPVWPDRHPNWWLCLSHVPDLLAVCAVVLLIYLVLL